MAIPWGMGHQLGVYHTQIRPSEHIKVLSSQSTDITGYQESRHGFQVNWIWWRNMLFNVVVFLKWYCDQKKQFLFVFGLQNYVN